MRSIVTLLCSFTWTNYVLVSGETCGPIGFSAKELLKPGFWYFDLPQSQCPPSPVAKNCSIPAPSPPQVNGTSDDYCRIYMEPCHKMDYQCSGAVCARYLETRDDIANLGYIVPDPFVEGHDYFGVSYTGDELPCTNGLTTSSINIKFMCDHNATWHVNDTKLHHGSAAPQPISAHFDCDNCQYNIVFNYSDACFKLPPGETLQKSISMGSIALILFFPGIALYFIVGILVNRTRGRTGKESIPHVQFWQDLPELIMDGFVFTMSALTCRQNNENVNYDTM